MCDASSRGRSLAQSQSTPESPFVAQNPKAGTAGRKPQNPLGSQQTSNSCHAPKPTSQPASQGQWSVASHTPESHQTASRARRPGAASCLGAARAQPRRPRLLGDGLNCPTACRSWCSCAKLRRWQTSSLNPRQEGFCPTTLPPQPFLLTLTARSSPIRGWFRPALCGTQRHFLGTHRAPSLSPGSGSLISSPLQLTPLSWPHRPQPALYLLTGMNWRPKGLLLHGAE